MSAALVWIGTESELNKGEWASWVQAVGSVVAIVSAYYLGAAQAASSARAALDAEARAASRRKESILAICSAVMAVIEPIPDRAFNTNAGHLAVGKSYDRRVFEALSSALGAVPIHELGSATAVESFFGIRNTLALLQDRIDTFWQLDIPPWAALYPDGVGDEASALKTDKLKARIKSYFERLAADFFS